MDDPRATRRTVLGAAAVVAAELALPGCRPFGPDAQRRLAAVDPDRPRLVAALAAEVSLLDGCDAAIATAPSLAAVLGAIRSDHAAHRAVLDAELARRPAASSPEFPPTAEASSGPAAPPPPAVPADPSAGLRDLTVAETVNAAARSEDAVAAAGSLAAVLGSIAASEAAHAAVLATGPATVPVPASALGPAP